MTKGVDWSETGCRFHMGPTAITVCAKCGHCWDKVIDHLVWWAIK